MAILSSIRAWEIPWTEEPGAPGPLLAELHPAPPPRAAWGLCRCPHAPVTGPEQKLRLLRVVLPKPTPQPAPSSACLVGRPCGPPAPGSAQAVTPPRTPHQDSVDRAYFAVFDGHGGADAARYASVHVHAVAARQPELATDWDPDSLRPALSLGGQASAWEGSPGRSLCLTKSSACGRLWQFAHPRPLSLLQRGLAPTPALGLCSP